MSVFSTMKESSVVKGGGRGRGGGGGDIESKKPARSSTCSSEATKQQRQ